MHSEVDHCLVVIPDAKSKDGDQAKRAMQSKIIANGGKCQQIVGKNPQGVMVVFLGSGMRTSSGILEVLL